jgi:hypothetical protein
MAAIQSPVETRASELFRRCLTRPPSSDELARLVDFYHRQRERLASGELDAQAIAGTGDGNHAERAAWTVLARTLFNLDEMITKN